VLAGHSFGGLYVQTFAANYPDQVAGLVLLDSTAPKPGPALPTRAESYSVFGRVSTLLPAVAHLGAGRLIAQAPMAIFRRVDGSTRRRAERHITRESSG
jgi:pimeloyl-ACP methyl ester carboxylesterase